VVAVDDVSEVQGREGSLLAYYREQVA